MNDGQFIVGELIAKITNLLLYYLNIKIIM